MNYKYENLSKTRSTVQARGAVTEKSKSSGKALSLSLDKKKISNVVRIIFILIYAFITLYPLLWMVSSSFKSPSEVFTPTSSLITQEFVLTNYRDAWQSAPFPLFINNSLQIAILSTVMQLLTSSLAAYAFAKIKFVGRNFLFSLILVGMMIPGEATIIPNYIFVDQLSLRNSILGISIVSFTSIFTIFLLRQHISLIPDALLESAEIDGASEFRKFFSIVLPNIKGILATAAILAFMNSWNDYMWPYLMTDSESSRTIQIGLKYLIDPDLGPDWPKIMAASTMVTLPVLILYFAFQRYFVAGITSTGIK